MRISYRVGSSYSSFDAYVSLMLCLVRFLPCVLVFDHNVRANVGRRRPHMWGLTWGFVQGRTTGRQISPTARNGVAAYRVERGGYLLRPRRCGARSGSAPLPA